jgi:hypothetical protein
VNVYYDGEWIKCEPLLQEDYEIKEILSIMSKIDDKDEQLNLREIGQSLFHLAASPSRLHGMGSIQIQALANLGYVLFTTDEKSISRRHLYEKVFLAFFIPQTKSKNA